MAVSIWSVSWLAIAQDKAPINRVDDETLQASFRKLKRNDSLQFELPNAPPAPKTPGWLKALGEFLNSLFSLLAPLLKIVFWIGLGVLIAGALYLLTQTIYTAIQARKDRAVVKTPAVPPPLYQPEHKQARILLDEIDALAAQGRYDEAVHTLLFRSIQDIDANRPNVIRRSLTSREIGQLPILTPQAQDAFGTIAQIVEHAYFGGHTIGQTEFDQARAAYASLALGEAADRMLAA
jgi:hypothetical protein